MRKRCITIIGILLMTPLLCSCGNILDHQEFWYPLEDVEKCEYVDLSSPAEKP